MIYPPIKLTYLIKIDLFYLKICFLTRAQIFSYKFYIAISSNPKYNEENLIRQINEYFKLGTRHYIL